MIELEDNMFLNPDVLHEHPHIVEEIEKASLRLVTQALYDFRYEAAEIFAREPDLKSDIGEDVTREALDFLGVSKISVRLFGKVDYKRCRYIFFPNYAVRQALFVDSKAEKGSPGVIRLQTSQTSMEIRQIVQGEPIQVKGKLPFVIDTDKGKCLVTTIFVKYNYEELEDRQVRLRSITIVGLPNGILQDRYNPTPNNGIWNVGPHSPTRGEEFRTRISCAKLRAKKRWRVQEIELYPEERFSWAE